MIDGSFTPKDEADIPVLVSRALFEECVEAMAKAQGKEFEVKYGGTLRGTVTYCEATVYDLDPIPDSLTVGQ